MKAAVDELADYDQLYRTHHARVLRLCRVLLSDPHEADDVAQEVFLKLFQTQQTATAAITWGPWLTRVTVNACHDRRRSGWWKFWRREHREFDEAQIATRSPTPEQEAVSNEVRQEVWHFFRQLSERQQAVFVLRQIEGWSTEEVAETLGLSTGTVKRHLFRAVHHLRKALGDR